MKIIKEYEKACQKIAQEINKKYFEGEAEIDWVAEDIGGVLMIADYFFDVDEMITALKYKATEKQFFDWYNLRLTQSDFIKGINFKNYILYVK